MGTWSQNSAGVWTLDAGGVDAVVVADRIMPAAVSLKLHCTSPAHQVKGFIRASKDGRTRIQVGIEGADAIIRTVHFAAPSGGHSPGAPDYDILETASHGLAAGQPFVMDIRDVEGVISLYLNGSETAVVEFDDSADPAFPRHRHFGFESDQAGATVTLAESCNLIQQFAEYSEIGFAVVDGYLWYCEDADPTRWRRLGGRIFNASGRVGLLDFRSRLYGLDGTNPTQVNPATFTVSPWVVPADVAKCTMLTYHLSRVVAAGNKDLPFAAFMSAINDADDWDFSLYPETPGAAWSLPASTRPQIGQPITCIASMGTAHLFMGCAGRGMFLLIGDPALGQAVDVVEIEAGAGVSGPDASVRIGEGRLLVHSPSGLYTITGLAAVNISEDVLEEGLTFTPDDAAQHRIILARDSLEKLCYVFISPIEEGPGRSFAYSEIVGGFVKGTGGLYPQVYPDEFGPTAACLWRGKILRGTRDGRLVWDDRAAVSDDGEAIDGYFTAEIVDDPPLARDTVLDELRVLLAEGSASVTYRIFGGPTPEIAFGRQAQDLLVGGVVEPWAGAIYPRVRAPALALELRNAGVDETFRTEEIQAITHTDVLTRGRSRTRAAPPAPCPAPVAAAGGSGPGGGPGNAEDLGFAFVPIDSIHEGGGASLHATSPGAETPVQIIVVPFLGSMTVVGDHS